jgi:hypothetical protein
LRFYPLSLEYSPKRFRKVEMLGVRGKKEDEKSSLFPKNTVAHDFLGPMNPCVIKHDNGLFPDAKRQVIKIFDDSVGVDGFCCGKPVITGIPVNDSKAIEPEFSIGRDVIILSPKKRLKGSSGAVLPEDASHADFAAFTPCLSASTALRIVSWPASLLITGLEPYRDGSPGLRCLLKGIRIPVC